MRNPRYTYNYIVSTKQAGSRVVAHMVRPTGELLDIYIDVRTDVRYPGWSFIELVRRGQVKHGECVHDSIAPGRIVHLMRNPFTNSGERAHYGTRRLTVNLTTGKETNQ